MRPIPKGFDLAGRGICSVGNYGTTGMWDAGLETSDSGNVGSKPVSSRKPQVSHPYPHSSESFRKLPAGIPLALLRRSWPGELRCASERICGGANGGISERDQPIVARIAEPHEGDRADKGGSQDALGGGVRRNRDPVG